MCTGGGDLRKVSSAKEEVEARGRGRGRGGRNCNSNFPFHRGDTRALLHGGDAEQHQTQLAAVLRGLGFAGDPALRNALMYLLAPLINTRFEEEPTLHGLSQAPIFNG